VFELGTMLSRSKLIRRGLVVAAVSVIALGASPASASAPIRSSVTCCTFDSQSYTINPGEVANFVNQTAGTVPHNVTASQKGPDGAPLFISSTITGGNTNVNGTQYLGPGSYHFICTIHSGMESDLVVAGNGTPVARPQISLKIVSSKLAKVRRSGTLKVRVTAQTDSANIGLSAKKGTKTLTKSSGGLNLSAGASQIVSLHLTKSGKRALSGIAKATVKATGTVDFGANATAKRTLR
jgi:plastocyanin